jgi:hypothetical protein
LLTVLAILLSLASGWVSWSIARATDRRSVKAVSQTIRFRDPVVLRAPTKIERHTERVLVEVPIPVMQPRDTEKGERTWADLERVFDVDFGNIEPGSNGLSPGLYPLEVADSNPSLYGFRNAAALRISEDGSTRVQIIAAEKTANENAWGWWGLTEFYSRGGAVLTSNGLTGTVAAGLVQDVARRKRIQGQVYAEAGYDFAQYDFDLDGWRVEAGIQLARRWGRPQ